MRSKRACRFAPQRGIDGPVNRAAKVCSSETILEEASLSITIAGMSAMSFRHSDGERLRSKRVYEFAQQRGIECYGPVNRATNGTRGRRLSMRSSYRRWIASVE